MHGRSAQKILVIKLGAFGDFIQALGPMAAIRRYHGDAHITLLTTAPYQDLAMQSGYFDAVQIDSKPRWNDGLGWLRLARYLRSEKFTRVYDLQNSQRTALYYRLFGYAPRPEWVGATAGASHRNASKKRTAGHAFDGHVQTLKIAGIDDVKIDRLDWMDSDLSAFNLQAPYVLLIPGASPSRPEKRWPPASYARLAVMLVAVGYQPVIIGGRNEQGAAQIILAACPESLDLTNNTQMVDIAALARNAKACIGNDTGPLHVAAATGCQTIALFSGHSSPVKHAPQGASVKILQSPNLDALNPQDVMRAFNAPDGTKI